MKEPTHCKNTCENNKPELTMLGAEKILAETGSWSGFTARMLVIKLQRKDVEAKDLVTALDGIVYAYDNLAKTAQSPSLLMHTLSSINDIRELLAKHKKQGK